MMRRFGRQCRGIGQVLVTLVRQTETHVLEMGEQVLPLARAAQAHLHGAIQLSEEQRARLHTQLTAALEAPHRIERQSRRLPQGKTLSHGKIVNAYDPTMAPICKGKSNCPAQVGTRPSPAIHALAGDLALNDAALRETLHARGILTVGIPRTVDPLPPSPTPADVLRSLDESDLHHIRTPSQVHLAYTCGDSRPVVEASWPACSVVEPGTSPTKAIAARSSKRGWLSWRTTR
jgi:hypothetical protein